MYKFNYKKSMYLSNYEHKVRCHSYNRRNWGTAVMDALYSRADRVGEPPAQLSLLDVTVRTDTNTKKGGFNG